MYTFPFRTVQDQSLALVKRQEGLQAHTRAHGKTLGSGQVLHAQNDETSLPHVDEPRAGQPFPRQQLPLISLHREVRQRLRLSVEVPVRSNRQRPHGYPPYGGGNLEVNVIKESINSKLLFIQ